MSTNVSKPWSMRCLSDSPTVHPMILFADINAAKLSKLSACPADIPVYFAENKCKTCSLQYICFCQSLLSVACDLNSCVTCPVGMKFTKFVPTSFPLATVFYASIRPLP